MQALCWVLPCSYRLAFGPSRWALRCSGMAQSIAFGNGLRAMLQGSRVPASMVVFYMSVVRNQVFEWYSQQTSLWAFDVLSLAIVMS